MPTIKDLEYSEIDAIKLKNLYTVMMTYIKI
jgi:hypothetical protein